MRAGVDSGLVRPLIIALGRSDNHPLLAAHAHALGVEYLGLEGFEASDLIRERSALARWAQPIMKERPIFLAAIDVSISAATLHSFASALHGSGFARLSLRTESSFLHGGFLHGGPLAKDSLQGPPGVNDQKTDHHEIEALHLLSVARSPHGQVALWPIITVDRAGNLGSDLSGDRVDEEVFSSLIEQVIKEVTEQGLVGVVTYLIEPTGHAIVRREFGASTFTFWSESASHTSVTEQMVRAILDLPLGDTRTIDFEDYFLEEEIALAPGLILDPIRPFLHLFARNPRLKVRYIQDGGGSRLERARLSLFASSDSEAHHEMKHGKDFMLGLAGEHDS